MTNDDFWTKVKKGCEKLNIDRANFDVWKHRGEVPAKHRYKLRQATRMPLKAFEKKRTQEGAA